MAKFKIKKSKNIHNESGEIAARIEYEMVEGKLLPGDVFRLYETHHYTNYAIQTLFESYFLAKPSLWFDGVYEEEILDTDNLKSGRKRGYPS